MKRSASGQRGVRPSRGWASIAMVWMANTLVFLILYQASHLVVLNEIRNHAMGVAIAAASGLSAADLEAVRASEDQATPAYLNVQAHLDQAVQFNPDIRYIYTMRRSRVPFSPSTAYEYVVDQPARDRNRDGVIGGDEGCEPPGKPYDAAAFPAMMEAWEKPVADPEISSDPPYPDLISGYAPVRGPDHRTVAIVGVDITAETVQRKLHLLRVVMSGFWLLMGSLAHLVAHLYHGQRESRERARARNRELSARNELLRRAMQVAPNQPANPAPQMVFDRYDVQAAAAGNGVFRLFELDQDRLGFFLADLKPGTPMAALTLCAMDLLLEYVAAPAGETMASILPYADPSHPADVLRVLHRVLGEELPVGEGVSVLYGIIDFSADTWTYAALGCPPAVCLRATGPAEAGDPAAEPPMTPGRDVQPVEYTHPHAEGDLLILAGPGHEDHAGWTQRVLQLAGSATSRQPLEAVSRLADRPVAAVLIR